MKKFFLIVISLVVIIYTSCSKKDWLNEKPRQDLATPTSFKDLQALLDNTGTINLNSPGLGEVADATHYVTDAIYQGFLLEGERNAYTWSKQFQFKVVADWNESYRKVFLCNIVLEQIQKIISSDNNEQNTWNDIKGQALFVRGKTFYELAQVYSPVFDSSKSGADLSVPLRLESDINIVSVRSSVKQTYDQVLADLTEASNLLPDFTPFPTRPSKVSAFAMLARIYLSMENYAKAFQYGDRSLQLYNTLMDFNSVTLMSQNVAFAKFNPEVLYHSVLVGYASIVSATATLVDTNFYNLFHTNDLRRNIYFRANANGTVNFRGKYSGSSAIFNGPAVDEMYLIRAKSNARLGHVNAAMKDLNDLLRTRWKKNSGITSYVDQAAVDAEEALKRILVERKKELFLRGLRWNDLRRLNKDDRFKVTMSRMVLGKTYIIEPNSYKYTFPIPDDVIAQTGIQQNVDW